MHPENNKGGTPMKKLLAVLLTVALMASLLSFAGAEDYTIRIYSNSNSPERTTWLIEKAKEAGFTISIDDNTVISGDTAAECIRAYAGKRASGVRCPQIRRSFPPRRASLTAILA